MEPRIQYARMKDGVRIAFWAMGERMPLVQLPVPPWSHRSGWADWAVRPFWPCGWVAAETGEVGGARILASR